MARFYRLLLWIACISGGVALLAGYLGGLHPAFDSAAVLRHYLVVGAVVLLILALISRLFGVVWLCLLMVVSGSISLWPFVVTTQVPSDFSLLQTNLLFRNDAAGLLDYVQTVKPDVITFQEVTAKSRANLQSLTEYQTQISCDFAGIGGVGIWSRYPLAAPDSYECNPGSGFVWARLNMPPYGEVTFVSLHLHWPWPYGQSRHLDQMIPLLAALPQPIVVAGDFNMVPWGYSVRRVQEATDTLVIPGLRFTLSLFGGMAQLPIDHVLIGSGMLGSATRGPRLGSDHNTILARIAFLP